MLTVVALGSAGCSPIPGQDAGFDAGAPDAGCMLPSDFPPDASAFVIDAVCNCPRTSVFHCYEEGGPQCSSWTCYPQKATNNGYTFLPDGGVQCLC